MLAASVEFQRVRAQLRCELVHQRLPESRGFGCERVDFVGPDAEMFPQHFGFAAGAVRAGMALPTTGSETFFPASFPTATRLGLPTSPRAWSLALGPANGELLSADLGETAAD